MNVSIEARGLVAAERSYYLAATGGFAGDVVDRLNDLSRDPEQHEVVVSLGNAALRGLGEDTPGAERHKDDIARVISDIDRTVRPREEDEEDRFYLGVLALSRDPESFLSLLDGGGDDYDEYRARVREAADKQMIAKAHNFHYAQSFRQLREFLAENTLLSDDPGLRVQYDSLARVAREKLGLEE